MKAVMVFVGAFASGMVALARPHYLLEISQLKPNSRLTRSCGICHQPGKEFTAEGIAFQELQFELGVPSSFELWERWFALDPNFDGVLIGEDLDQDR